MAGGQGTRFWPISRLKCPKQFLSLTDSGVSLIRATADRVRTLCTPDSLYVVTGPQHAELAKQHVPFAQIIREPEAKNTAASIGLAAVILKQRDPEAVMVVLPADHTVREEALLNQALGRAIEIAAKEKLLVTVGIRPSFAHTGYGYMKRGSEIKDPVYRVSRFYEKPNSERAKLYVESGEYFWNSGMFVFRTSVILEAIAEYMPELHRALLNIESKLESDQREDALKNAFETLDSVSIDFGVLEHARNCAMVCAGDFGWSDVGSWDAWAESFNADQDSNVLDSNTINIGSCGCIVKSEKRTVAIVGAVDMVVIDSGDALLVCSRDSLQDVKKVVEELKARGKSELI